MQRLVKVSHSPEPPVRESPREEWEEHLANDRSAPRAAPTLCGDKVRQRAETSVRQQMSGQVRPVVTHEFGEFACQDVPKPERSSQGIVLGDLG